jgi:hypothetical protein
MSEDYYIGLSREQIEKLLAGEEVGKRPYYEDVKYPDTHDKYDGTVRIHVRMLTEEEKSKEPDAAFGW